jgi:hypothetical protein
VSRQRRWVDLALVVALVVGFLLVSSVAVVRDRLLDPGLYSSGLVRTDAYERVFTEVLADPELAELKEQLLGGMGVDPSETARVRALATSAVRLSIPPSAIRESTEVFIAALVGYLRGDTARLDGDLDMTEVLRHVEDGAVAWVQTRLAVAPDQVVPDVDAFRAEATSFVDQLERGTVPDTIPVLAGSVGPAAVDVIEEHLGHPLPTGVRQQVQAALAASDEREALILAAAPVLDVPVADAVAELRAGLEDRRDLDVTREIADRAGGPTNLAVSRLNGVRDAAAWFGSTTAAAGAALMVGAGAGLVWRHRRRPRHAVYWLAGGLVTAGLALVASWMFLGVVLDSPLAPATQTGPSAWNLPPGVRSLLGDVESAIADDLAGTIRRLALVPIAVGGALAAGLTLGDRLQLTSRTRVVAGIVAGVVVLALGVVVLPSLLAAPEPRACNGHPELCDRPYDEVVFAATHNSMSSPDVVLVWPEHDANISAQLEYGIRALLIDTHHWTPLVSAEQITLAFPLLGPRAADELYTSLGSSRDGRDGTFLCHNECSLGAIDLVDSLAAITDFLDDNPDEVVTLIIQDAITTDETADAFERAGLDRYLHEHAAGSEWATLEDLIDSGERLIVFAENDGPPPAWYHQAFEHMQDTPYRFRQTDDFDCTVNRGAADTSLFLLNHWLSRDGSSPDRAAAAVANRHDVIVDRALACERERGLLPNFVAVDFFNIGDVTDAVDTLNGIE